VSVANEIRAFITRSLLKGKAREVGDDESLIGSGILDSVSWLQLVSHIEKHYRLTVEDDELSPDKFDTIRAIADFIAQKQSS
jgi:acyl carrier protein